MPLRFATFLLLILFQTHSVPALAVSETRLVNTLRANVHPPSPVANENRLTNWLPSIKKRNSGKVKVEVKQNFKFSLLISATLFSAGLSLFVAPVFFGFLAVLLGFAALWFANKEKTKGRAFAFFALILALASLVRSLIQENDN